MCQFTIEAEVEPTHKEVIARAAPAVHGRAVLAFHPNIYGVYGTRTLAHRAWLDLTVGCRVCALCTGESTTPDGLKCLTRLAKAVAERNDEVDSDPASGLDSDVDDGVFACLAACASLCAHPIAVCSRFDRCGGC